MSHFVLLIVALVIATRLSDKPITAQTEHYIYAAGKDIEVAVISIGVHQDHERENCTHANCTSNEIGFQKEKYQLHVKVKGKHIKGSPLLVTTFKKFGTPIQTITGLWGPQGVAFNYKGDMIVTEYPGNRVSIFNPKGDKFLSFGTQGSGPGQFNYPQGVAVDDNGSILVVDRGNHRLQKFTPDGRFLLSLGTRGTKPLEFDFPSGIGIHPHTKRIYVTETKNQRVQILNPDMTFLNILSILFKDPLDVAFDSDGNVYVVDRDNHQIQVFTAEGQYLRKIGNDGELEYPTAISIDSDNIVYIAKPYKNHISLFTCEGKFLTSFGTHGRDPGQFWDVRGIATDKNGSVYVSDYGNDRIQVF